MGENNCFNLWLLGGSKPCVDFFRNLDMRLSESTQICFYRNSLALMKTSIL